MTLKWRNVSKSYGISLLSVLLLASVSCTRDVGVRQPHSADRTGEASPANTQPAKAALSPSPTSVPTSGPTAAPGAPAASGQDQPGALTGSAATPLIAASAAQQAAAREFEKFFNTDSLQQRATRPDQAFRDEVSKHLLQGAQLLSTSERQAILSAFHRAALLGCDDDLKGCSLAHFFRRTPGAVDLYLAAADEVISQKMITSDSKTTAQDDSEAKSEKNAEPKSVPKQDDQLKSNPPLGRRDAILNRHRLLRLAFAATGATHDSRIGQAWILSAKAYEDALGEALTESENARNNSQAESLRRRWTESQETVDLSLQQMTSDSPQAQALLHRLVQDYGAWNFDSARDPRLNSRREALLRAVAPRLLSDEFIQNDLKKISTRSDSSASQLNDLIRVRPWAQESLGIHRELELNFNTWLFESLWLGRITTTEAVILREAHQKRSPKNNPNNNSNNNSKINTNSSAKTNANTSTKLDATQTQNNESAALREQQQDLNAERVAFENYLRTRLILSARRANSVIANFFQGGPGQSKTNESNRGQLDNGTSPHGQSNRGQVNSENAVQAGISESNKGQQIWADSKRRFENLRLFYDRSLRPSLSSGLQNVDQTRSAVGKSQPTPQKVGQNVVQNIGRNVDHGIGQNVELFFASLDRNIKFTSTYPSMLIMAYHLARLNFEMRILTLSGVQTIDGGQIFRWFINGEVTPWFEYGSDRQGISAPEIPMVFHYALELGTLEQAEIDLAHLFKLLAAQTIGPHRATAERILLAYRTRFVDSADLHEFRALCREVTSPNAKVSLRTSFSEIKRYASFGLPQSISHSRKVMQEAKLDPWASHVMTEGGSFYANERDITSQSLDENLEALRLDLGSILGKVQIFERMALLHLDRASRFDQSRNAQINELSRAIRTPISQIERVQNEAYRLIARINDEIGPCIDRMARHELTSQTFAVSAWIDHLKQVHARMTQMRQISLTQEGAPNGQSRLDSASEKGIQFQTEFNLLSRLQKTGEQLAGYAEHESALGYDAEVYRTTDLQFVLRMKSFLEDGAMIEGRYVPGPRQVRSILLPPRVKDLPSDFRASEIRIPYHDDVNEFVDFALRATVGGNSINPIQWADQNSIAHYLKKRIRALAALNLALASTHIPKQDLTASQPQASPNQIQQNPIDQTRENRLQPRVQDLHLAAIEMLKWLEPNEVWTRVLRARGQGQRADVDFFLDEIAWRKGDDQPRGLLDYVFETVTADKLGETEGAQATEKQASRPSIRNDFLTYRRSLSSRGQTAIVLPSEAEQLIKDFYENRFNSQLQLTADFLRIAERVDRDRRNNPERYPAWRMNVLRSKRDPLSIATVSSGVLSEFKSQLGELSRETNHELPSELKDALAAAPQSR